MTKYNDILNKLTAIQNELLAENNIYYLSASEKNDVRIVTNTLIYIVNHIDELQSRTGDARAAFLPADEKMQDVDDEKIDYASIHLEEYEAGEAGEKQIIGALVKMFIDNFNDAKTTSAQAVKRFCSYLNGNCIDGRTRSAFDYISRLHNPPEFTVHIENAINTLTGLNIRKKDSYFSVFAALLNTCWGTPYSADAGNYGLCKTNGIFNDDSFSLIKTALTHLSLQPGADFLMAAYDVQPPLHSTFFRFVLFHPNLLDQLQITSSASLTTTTFEYNKIFTNISIIENLISYDENASLSQKFLESILLEKLLDRCHPETCIDLTLHLEQNNIINQPILNIIMKQLYETKKENKELFEAVVNKKHHITGNTLLHVLARSRMDHCSSIILELTQQGANIKARNNYGCNPVDYAIIFDEPKIADDIIEHFYHINDNNLHSQLFGNTLQLAAEHKYFSLAEKLLDRNIYIEYNGSLTNAYFFIAIILNNVNFADLVYKKNIANLGSKPIIVTALEEKCVTQKTFTWLLNHPLGDANAIWDNKPIFQIALETKNLEKIQELLFHIDDIDSAQEMAQQEQDRKYRLDILNLFLHPKLSLKLFQKKYVDIDDKGAADILNRAYYNNQHSMQDYYYYLTQATEVNLNMKILARFFSSSYKTIYKKQDLQLMRNLMEVITNFLESPAASLSYPLKKSLKIASLNALNLAVENNVPFVNQAFRFCAALWAPKPMLIVALEEENIDDTTFCRLLQTDNTDIDHLIWEEKSFITRAVEGGDTDKINLILLRYPNSRDAIISAAKIAQKSAVLSLFSNQTPSSLYASASAPTFFASDEKPSNNTTPADTSAVMQTDNQRNGGALKRKLE